MKNHNCNYNTKVSENELYIATKEELFGSIDPHTRITAAMEKYNSGEKMEILTFQELYELLNVTEDDLKNRRIPTVEEKDIKNQNSKNYSTGEISVSIGNMISKKGINFSKLGVN